MLRIRLEIKNFLCNHVPAFYIFVGLSLVSLCGGCSGKNESVNNDTIIFEDAFEVEETVDSVIENKKEINVWSENPDSLSRYMRNSTEWDRYRQGILPMMTETAPEYLKKLLNNEYSGFIVVDKSRMKVILFDKYGIEKKSYGMACAKNYGTKHEKGDSKTPEGFFSVEGTYDSTEWLFRDDNGKVSKKKGQFGPRFIRLRIPGTSQIGIHGTCAPWSIGCRASHGCIRIKNENILELVELVEPGMPVIIVPGKKDMIENLKNDIEIPWIATAWNAKKPKTDVEKDDNMLIQQSDTIPSNDSISHPVDTIQKSIEAEPVLPDSILQ